MVCSRRSTSGSRRYHYCRARRHDDHEGVLSTDSRAHAYRTKSGAAFFPLNESESLMPVMRACPKCGVRIPATKRYGPAHKRAEQRRRAEKVELTGIGGLTGGGYGRNGSSLRASAMRSMPASTCWRRCMRRRRRWARRLTPSARRKASRQRSPGGRSSLRNDSGLAVPRALHSHPVACPREGA